MIVRLVPSHEVLAGDGLDGGVFRHARQGRVRAIDQPGDLARGDAADVVVPAGDAGIDADLGEVEFLLREGGCAQDLIEDLEDIVEILLQAIHAGGAGIAANAGLDGGGAGGQEIINLVSGLAAGAAGALDRAHQAGEADFVRGLVI